MLSNLTFSLTLALQSAIEEGLPFLSSVCLNYNLHCRKRLLYWSPNLMSVSTVQSVEDGICTDGEWATFSLTHWFSCTITTTSKPKTLMTIVLRILQVLFSASLYLGYWCIWKKTKQKLLAKLLKTASIANCEPASWLWCAGQHCFSSVIYTFSSYGLSCLNYELFLSFFRTINPHIKKCKYFTCTKYDIYEILPSWMMDVSVIRAYSYEPINPVAKPLYLFFSLTYVRLIWCCLWFRFDISKDICIWGLLMHWHYPVKYAWLSLYALWDNQVCCFFCVFLFLCYPEVNKWTDLFRYI